MSWRHGGNLSFYLLSGRSQYEKATYCMIPTMWCSGEGITEIVKRLVDGCSSEGVEKKEV